jgi:hypothetical protein
MKTKTLFRLVDNLVPRAITTIMFVIVIACCMNTIDKVISGDYKNAAFFALLTFLFCILTDYIYQKLWTPKK